MSNSLQLHGQNTGVGSLSLLQGIFPTQGLNPGLLHCKQILYQLSHKGSPRILEWVAYPFSRGSSHPRDWTRVSCIAGGFFANWTIREVLKSLSNLLQYFFCFTFCFAFPGVGCLFWSWCMWELSSLTRDWSHTPLLDSEDLNSELPGESPPS